MPQIKKYKLIEVSIWVFDPTKRGCTPLAEYHKNISTIEAYHVAHRYLIVSLAI